MYIYIFRVSNVQYPDCDINTYSVYQMYNIQTVLMTRYKCIQHLDIQSFTKTSLHCNFSHYVDSDVKKRFSSIHIFLFYSCLALIIVNSLYVYCSIYHCKIKYNFRKCRIFNNDSIE